jgi:hypothetical protein
MSRLVNLDDVAGLEAAFAELERVHRIRQVEPELRADILRAIDRAVEVGRLSDDEAALFRAELDEVHPAVWLEEHWSDLVPDRPLTDTSICRDFNSAPNVEAEIRQRVVDNPVRWLGHLTKTGLGMFEKSETVGNAVLTVALRAGLPLDFAKSAVRKALKGGDDGDGTA